MEKKKNKGRNKTSRLEQILPDTEPGQAESDDGVEEIFGVHVISDEDIKKHFGVSPGERRADIPDQKTEIE